MDRAEKHLRAGETRPALEVLSRVRCQAADGPACRARLAAATGRAHLFAGAYPEAAAAFAEALGEYRRLGDVARTITTLNNLGTVHFYRGEYADAYRQYAAARTEWERASEASRDAASAQLTAANLAALHQRLGRYRQALEAYQSLGPAPEGLSRSERAQMLSNLAVLNRRLGDPWKARALLQQALGLLDRAMERETWLGVVKNLGIVEALDFQDLEAARRHFETALAVAVRLENAREAMQARLYLAETWWRMEQPERALGLWKEALAGSRALETPEDEWRSGYGIARCLRRLGRVAEAWAALGGAMQTIEAIRAGIGSATLRTEFLSDKGDVYEEALDLAVERGEPEAAFRYMERARALVLREGLRLGEIPLAQFQARLRPDEAALLYRAGKKRSYLLWVTRDRAGARRLELAETAAAGWIEEVRKNPGGSLRPALELSAALLATVPQRRRLWIVPDGVLAFLPFELLPVEGSLLLKQAEIVYLPFAGFLRSTPVRRAGLRWPWRRALFAYADPDVQKVALLPGDERWGRLPQSLAEVRAIAGILAGRTLLRAGAERTPGELLAEAAGAPLVHLATHGAGDPENADRNRLLLGSGYLFGSQLQPNQLPRLRLAVLSACETDYGVLSRGEGVQSLARSFLLAGAEATVATLWRVDDAASRLLMEEFYGNLERGADPAGALRQAKLRFATSVGNLKDPRHWAAFVVQGNAGEPLPPAVRWWHLVAVAAVLAGGGAVVVSRTRAAG